MQLGTALPRLIRHILCVEPVPGTVFHSKIRPVRHIQAHMYQAQGCPVPRICRATTRN